MQLEEYFECLTPEDIRVKGTRSVSSIFFTNMLLAVKRQKKLPIYSILLAWSRFLPQFCIICAISKL